MSSLTGPMRNTSRTAFCITRRSLASTAAVSKPQKKERPAKQSQAFCMNLFRGQLAAKNTFPYPNVLDDDQKEMLNMITDPTMKFFEEVNDPAANDANECYPKEVLERFAELGAFGALVPPEYEGAGLNNTQMAKLAEIVGMYDLAMGVTMGAHQSIGYKGILLFGSDEMKKKYLPDLASGRKFASFCLTEPSSGSDANSIRSKAELSADGSHYVLNGSKVWISNGGFAEIFTVFAQTPCKTESGEMKNKVSAFVVERGFGGVTNGPPEKKMGIKASNTVEVYFENVKIPKENLIGEHGDGFKVAMNILNNGRFGIPAAMTGVIRHCMNKSVEFAGQRVQFGRKLKEFKDIKEKIADMAMKHYVCESILYMLSGMMDNQVMDYQLEAAIGKIITSEYAWQVCDEAIQIHGGMGFMKEPGLERFQRDLRIFRIFEGTNDILRLFVSLTGLQFAGGHLREVQKALKSPVSNMGSLLSFASGKVSRSVGMASGPSLSGLVDSKLQESGNLTSKCIGEFGNTVEAMLMKSGKAIIEEQNQQRRLADAAIEIYAQVCVLSRCSHSQKMNTPSAATELAMAQTFIRQSTERALLSLAKVTSATHNADWAVMDKIADEVFATGGVVTQHPLGGHLA